MSIEKAAASSARHRVVIVGAGFGGLAAIQHLKGAHVDIRLVDQRTAWTICAAGLVLSAIILSALVGVRIR